MQNLSIIKTAICFPPNCSFAALVGTLKAAKRKKIVTYTGELLLQGVHDNVDIVLLKDEE